MSLSDPDKKEEILFSIKIIMREFLKISYLFIGLIVAIFFIDLNMRLIDIGIVQQYNIIHMFAMIFIIIMFTCNIMNWYKRRIKDFFRW